MRTLVAGCGSPAQVLELYYWSREPGFLEIMRSVAAMPEQTRAAFEAFLAIARDPKTITADLSAVGLLTMSSPEARRTVALVHHVAASDEAPTMN